MSERSCGIIPFRQNGNSREYLLIQHNAGHWGFPKGHKNPGETDLATAQRELLEETGLKIDKVFATHPFVEDYFYKRDKKTVHKTVTYFAALVRGKVKIQEEELKSYAWLQYRSAYNRVPYPEMKNIVKKVNKISISEFKPRTAEQKDVHE